MKLKQIFLAVVILLPILSFSALELHWTSTQTKTGLGDHAWVFVKDTNSGQVIWQRGFAFNRQNAVNDFINHGQLEGIVLENDCDFYGIYQGNVLATSDESAEFVIKSYMKSLSDYFASKKGKTYRLDQACNDVVYNALLTIGFDVPAIQRLNAGKARQEIGQMYHEEIKPVIKELKTDIKDIAKSEEVKEIAQQVKHIGKNVKTLFKSFGF
ncbi:MAG: hypothetical protein HRT87_00400 [Legionellales bacterium]|nr:hypothetical protein [Legionellales bacterium]